MLRVVLTFFDFVAEDVALRLILGYDGEDLIHPNQIMKFCEGASLKLKDFIISRGLEILEQIVRLNLKRRKNTIDVLAVIKT